MHAVTIINDIIVIIKATKFTTEYSWIIYNIVAIKNSKHPIIHAIHPNKLYSVLIFTSPLKKRTYH